MTLLYFVSTMIMRLSSRLLINGINEKVNKIIVVDNQFTILFDLDDIVIFSCFFIAIIIRRLVLIIFILSLLTSDDDNINLLRWWRCVSVYFVSWCFWTYWNLKTMNVQPWLLFLSSLVTLALVRYKRDSNYEYDWIFFALFY